MKSIIEYFFRRPLLSNLMLFLVIGTTVLFWNKIGKEEYPDFSFNRLRVNIPYPGASAEDVELFIIRPIEEQLKAIANLYEVKATASYASGSFNITVNQETQDFQEIIQEIKDAVNRAGLPREAEDPTYRQFKSSQKAIIDVAMIYKGAHHLDVTTRTKLQKFALAFQDRLINLPEISGADPEGYLIPEIQILIDPQKLKIFDISLTEVKAQILKSHIRTPAGKMEDREETEVTVLAEKDNIADLENLIVRSAFTGQKVRLKQLAKIRHGFEKKTKILKINAHEGIYFNVQKNENVDILTAQKAVLKFVDKFRSDFKSTPLEIILIDDESYDVRNRLSLVTYNGLLGFVLIVLVLFIFLDFRSGIWVGIGIPFALSLTFIVCLLLDFTINNMTLAGIIIVLGIVVDDAIIIAENISRHKINGMPHDKAAIIGTYSVMRPILASILTTIAAFIPLYFFKGRFGIFVRPIPAIVLFMLLASLLESITILPGHLVHGIPKPKWLIVILNKFHKPKKKAWVFALEKKYAKALRKLLHFRVLILLFFILILIGGGLLLNHKFKYVLFPKEEARFLHVKAIAPEETTRKEMAKLISKLEFMFLEYKDIVTSVRTTIAQGRRGGEVKENEASLRIEIVPSSERNISLNKLIEKWTLTSNNFSEFNEIRFIKSRWGQKSGSSLEIEIRENSDQTRKEIVEQLQNQLEKYTFLTNVEIDRPVLKHEFQIRPKEDEINRLGVDLQTLATSLRSYIEGDILYTLRKGDEEIDVRFTGTKKNKRTKEDLLGLYVPNNTGHLVPYSNLVNIVPNLRPANIQRYNYKRTTKIFADIKEGMKVTPLEVADKIEREIFPSLNTQYLTANFAFRGEVEDSRESNSDFKSAILLALIIIYVILTLLYNSIFLPFLIGFIIPYGVVGVIAAFYLHGMFRYGFFSIIGTLGMVGVVVNDAIVMISMLETKLRKKGKSHLLTQIAFIASGRLRPIIVTTLTTVAGLLPTAYGLAGQDSMLSEMMLALAWGLLFGTLITLLLVPCIYSFYAQIKFKFSKEESP